MSAIQPAPTQSIGISRKILSLQNCYSHVVSLLFCCLLFPATALAISGPASSTSGEFTLTFTPPAPAPNFSLSSQWIRAYRNNVSVTSYSLALTANSHNVTVTENGNWRFDHWVRFRFCTIPRPGGGGCMEWDSTSAKIDDHTVAVDILTTPGIPDSITVPTLNDGIYTVNWGTASGTVTAYDLDKRWGTGNWFNFYEGPARSKAVSLAEGDHTYRVRACNSALGNTRCSDWRYSATAVTARPANPPGLTLPATDGDGSYALSWGNIGNTDTYQLQESISGGSWTTLQNTAANSFTATNRGNGTHSYRVWACNNIGCSTNYSGKSIHVALQPGTPASIDLPSLHGGGSVTIDWGSATGAVTKYDLDYRKDSGAWTNAYHGPLRSATMSVNAGSYSYRVRACNTVGSYTQCSGWRQSNSLTVAAPAGSPAISLAANDGDGSYNVSWSGIANTYSYTLQERAGSGSWGTVQNSGATTFAAAGRGNNTYAYRVQACNNVGCSAYSTAPVIAVAIAPGVPASITPPSSTALSASWGGAGGSVTGYDLDQRKDGGGWSHAYDGTATSTALPGLTSGGYQYRVRACKTVSTFTNCSNWRTSATVNLAPPGSAPDLSLATADPDGSYTVSWNSVSATLHYTLQERLNNGGWTTVQNNAATSLNATNGDGTYDYRVSACNALGCGPYSAVKSIDVALAPGVPASITLPSLHGSPSLGISWGSASGSLTSYDLDQQRNGGSWTHAYDGTSRNTVVNGLGTGDYKYRARGCNTVGSYTNCSAWRLSATVSLAAPTGAASLSVPATDSDGTYTVSWTLVTNAATYQLEEKPDFGNWATVQNTGATSYAAADKTFARYSYRVRACNSFGCGGRSAAQPVLVAPAVADWAQSVAVAVADAPVGGFSAATHDPTVGALAGDGGTSGGQATYTIPIQLPPGRAGMEPSVGLNYSSRGGNGVLGMGFSLAAVSTISRCGKTLVHDSRRGAVTYSATEDRLCLDGQRLLTVSGSYGSSGTHYRTELDTFARITQHGALNGLSTWFEVERKDGTIAYYGESTDSRVTPQGAPAVLSWQIKRERDRTAGQNTIRYHYSDFGRGEVALSDIYYTGNGNTDGDRRVHFAYENRPDVSSTYLAGGVTAQRKRLKTITTYYGADKVREYGFTYRLSQASGRSLLDSARECGFEVGAPVCLPASQLQWYEAAPQFVLEKAGYRPADTAAPAEEGGTLVPQLQNETVIEDVIPHGDANGDGSADWPTWFMNAEGIYQGANTSARRSCRRTGAYDPVCADGDFNRDGRTDAWRITGGRVQLSYNATAAGGGDWIDTPALIDSVKDGPYSIADYNADGWPDLVVSTGERLLDGQPRRLLLWLHSGNPQIPYSGAGHILFTYDETGDRYRNDVQLLGDMDGDGLPDMMEFSLGRSLKSSYARRLILTRLNAQGTPVFNHSVDVATHRDTLPNTLGIEADLKDFDYFMDVNGDGLTDWIAWVDISRLWLSLNRGDGSFAPWQDLGPQAQLAARTLLVPFLDETIDHYTPKFGHALRQFDYDADGRPELLVPNQRLVTICLRRIDGPVPRDICGDAIYRPFSMNGEQRTIDLPNLDANVYQYKAFHFVEAADGTFTVESRSTSLVGAANQTLAVDGFGNGLADLLFIHACRAEDLCSIDATSGVMAGADEGIYINRNRGSATGSARFEPADMLLAAEDGIGMRDTWHYRPLSSGDPRYHSAAKPFYEPDFDYLDTLSPAARAEHLHFSSSMYVVAEHRRRNGIGGENHFQNRYKGAMYHWRGRGFQGFRTLVVEDLARGTETRSDFHQVFPLAGRLHRLRQWQITDATGDGAMAQAPGFSTVDYSWQFWPLGGRNGAGHFRVSAPTDTWSLTTNQPYFVGPASQTEIRRVLDNSDRRETYRRTATTDFDDWGNITSSETRYQELGNSHQVTAREVSIYTSDTANWWLDKISSRTSTRDPIASRNGPAAAASTDIQQSITVDYQRWNTGARKPEKVLTTPSSGKTLTVEMVYNDYGLPTTQTTTGQGESPRTLTTVYSADGYFPRTVTNALGHMVETDTDPRFGLPNWVEDANDQRTTTEYDPFGRVTDRESLGIGPPTFTSLQWCAPCAVNDAVYRVITEQAGTPTQVAYIDRLGRTLRVQTDAFDAGQVTMTDTRYNALGQVVFESAPHFDDPAPAGTRYLAYDTLGRPTHKAVDQTAGQVLDITYTHDRGSAGFTTEIAAGGIAMSRTYNGLGQLTETVDGINGVTRYAYDGGGNPIVIEDAGGHQITAHYNALGQKVWVDDPNMGYKSFTYNGFGEVDSETDANNQTTAYHYDLLGRLRQRDVDGLGEARWHYDTAAAGIGLLASEERLDAGYSKTYGYDQYSRVDTVTTRIDGEDFTTRTQYDSHFGRAKGLIYPNGLTLSYHYNERGYRTAVDNAANGYRYRAVSNLDPYGQWRQAELAVGSATVTRQFHGETGQALELSLANLVGTLHRETYAQYDVFGNLEQTTLEIPSLSPALSTETYYYDDLHRLTLNQRTAGPDISYRYDATGNLLQKDDYATTYHYAGTRPNAVSQVDLVGGGTLSFGYDNNGNRTHENGAQTLWYNAFNKPTQITRNGSTLTFAYGADQIRYQQVDVTAGRTTLYVDKLFERTTETGSTRLRLFIEDIAVLTLTEQGGSSSQSIGFTHRDRLGSTVAITDHLGMLQETHSFDPFGKPRAGNTADKTPPLLASLWTTRGFTDHEHLDAVRLIHMNGRVYDYDLGRFLSVDPIIQAPGNSQGLNPYSYIMNNPLSGTDPTGYQSEKLESIAEPIAETITSTEYISRPASRIKVKVTKTVTVMAGGNLITGKVEANGKIQGSYYADQSTGGRWQRVGTLEGRINTGNCPGCHGGSYTAPLETPEQISYSKRFYQNLGEDLVFAPLSAPYHLMTGEYFFSGDDASRVWGAIGSAPYIGFLGRAIGKSFSPVSSTLNSSNALEGVERASQALINSVSQKRTVRFVTEGSEELRYLDHIRAEANVGGPNMTHILLRQNPSKAAVLEEFLHGTQERLGVIKRLGTGGAETHVKNFMIRHSEMLGLGAEDVRRLQVLKDAGL